MHQLYLEPQRKFFSFITKAVALFIMIAVTTFTAAQAQGLVFKNAELKEGQAGQPGAVYRFPQVANNLDALVKISNRSSSLVRLVSIDLTNTGWDKAWQPQVTYNNNQTPNGNMNYWMEFEITIVQANTTVPVKVSNLDLTALDIDGNGSRINEWVSLYNLKTYTVEKTTSLGIFDILENLLGILSLNGKKFEGPVTNYTNVDTAATNVMTTAKYENRSSFRIRTGANSNGSSAAADRMYSFWFKSFAYDAPVEGTLPVKLSAFTARKTDGKVVLNWATELEKNVSHFVIERSLNGINYTDAGMVITDGNSDMHREYSFTDDLKNVSGAIVYYRLKTVDLDAKYERSVVRIVRLTEEKGGNTTILTYPNPVVNELRITMPASWQDKPVTVDVYNTNGQIVKHIAQARVSQTETMNVSDLAVGVYIVKASNGAEMAIQRIVKSK